MKILAYSLLVPGFVLLALGHPFSDQPNYPMMFSGALMVVVGVFLRSRLRQGIPILEITDKDRAQFKELRREFGLRKLLADIIAGIGFISCAAGITYPLYAGSHPDLGWQDAVRCLVFGAFLLFCSWLITRRSRS